MPFDFFMSRYKEAYVLETLVSPIGLGSGLETLVRPSVRVSGQGQDVFETLVSAIGSVARTMLGALETLVSARVRVSG